MENRCRMTCIIHSDRGPCFKAELMAEFSNSPFSPLMSNSINQTEAEDDSSNQAEGSVPGWSFFIPVWTNLKEFSRWSRTTLSQIKGLSYLFKCASLQIEIRRQKSTFFIIHTGPLSQCRFKIQFGDYRNLLEAAILIIYTKHAKEEEAAVAIEEEPTVTVSEWLDILHRIINSLLFHFSVSILPCCLIKFTSK